jgi:2-methylcitrate dehydratase PrpD
MTAMPQDPPYAVLLAERILRPSLAETTPRAAAWVKMAIADTVACILAGVNEDTVRILLATEGIGTAQGSSLILGTNIRTNALDAALVNGTAAHALDYDDMLNIAVTHPSAVLLPPILALADKVKASGREVMTAYIAGLELGVRMALGTFPQHRQNGWHPTATIGTFCAVGAATRILKLDVARTAQAIGMACSEAGGIAANFGTMTKPFHAGQASRAGVLAATLAANGFTANPGALEHVGGFFNAFARGGTPNPEAMLQDFASPFDINIGAGIKQYPCCGGTHNAADLTLALRHEHALAPDTVERIEILAHPQTMNNLNRPQPKSGLDAKFSMQYVVGRALKDGALRLEHFENAAMSDETMRALLPKIHMQPHPTIDPNTPHIFATELVVHTKDGARIARYADKPDYRNLANPLSDAEMWEKFSDCAARTLPRDSIRRVYDLLMQLEGERNLEAINDLLAVDRVAAAAE